MFKAVASGDGFDDLAVKVKRSTMAAQSLGSVNVLVQPENASFRRDGRCRLLFPLGQHLEQQFGLLAVQLEEPELVQAEQIHPPVAGDGLGELLLAPETGTQVLPTADRQARQRRKRST